MLSESQIKRVWEGMLGADIRSNYFAELAERYRHRQKLATWFTLLCAGSDAATFLTSLPSGVAWLRPVLAILAAAASIYLALSDNEQKAFDSTDLQRRWLTFHSTYQAMWEDVEGENASHMAELERQIIEASALANRLANDQRAIKKWRQRTEAQYRIHSAA